MALWSEYWEPVTSRSHARGWSISDRNAMAASLALRMAAICGWNWKLPRPVRPGLDRFSALSGTIYLVAEKP